MERSAVEVTARPPAAGSPTTTPSMQTVVSGRVPLELHGVEGVVDVDEDAVESRDTWTSCSLSPARTIMTSSAEAR